MVCKVAHYQPFSRTRVELIEAGAADAADMTLKGLLNFARKASKYKKVHHEYITSNHWIFSISIFQPLLCTQNVFFNNRTVIRRRIRVLSLFLNILID